MKIAKEWTEELGLNKTSDQIVGLETIQSIQLDAYKAGMTEAHDWITKEQDYCAAPRDYHVYADLRAGLLKFRDSKTVDVLP